MKTMNESLRQKSCDICVKAKRKCDKQKPSCLRCVRMGVNCSYKSRFTASVRTQGLEERPEICDLISEPEPLNSNRLDSSTTVLEDSFTGTSVASASIDIEEILRSFSASTMPQDRVDYCVKQFKSYPRALLSCNRTPFIHPDLYKDFLPFPLALQEAYSICALYYSKTDATKSTIFRIIEAKSSQLLDSHTTWTVSKHLAGLQALCLFQVICLFDGDIRLRAIADQQESIVADLVADLCRRTNLASPLLPVPSSWHQWVFDESVRRTIIMCLMVQCVYAVVKQGFCCIPESVTSKCFTAQAALWGASSVYQWQKAVREKQHFEINQMDFTELLRRGAMHEKLAGPSLVVGPQRSCELFP